MRQSKLWPAASLMLLALLASVPAKGQVAVGTTQCNQTATNQALSPGQGGNGPIPGILLPLFAAGIGVPFDNRFQFCNTWILQWWSGSQVASLSIELDSSPPTAVPPAPASFTAVQSAATNGGAQSNPSSSLQGIITLSFTAPWVAVRINSITFSGGIPGNSPAVVNYTLRGSNAPGTQVVSSGAIQCNQVITDNGAPGRRAVFDNRFLGCNLWTVEWFLNGTISGTEELDGANDNAGVPGTFGTGFFYPSSLNTPQPIGLQVGILVLHGFAPWISFNIVGGNSTSLTVIIRGIYAQNEETFGFTQAGNGNGIPMQSCNGTVNIAVAAATTARLVAANANEFFSHICGFILTSSGVSVATIGTAAIGACASGITTVIGSFNLVAGVPIPAGHGLGSLFNVSNTVDLCLSAVTTQVNGILFFNQNNTQQ